MLTGDKGETAKEIGFSCGLFSRERKFKVIKIDEDDPNFEGELTAAAENQYDQFGIMIPGAIISTILSSLQLQ